MLTEEQTRELAARRAGYDAGFEKGRLSAGGTPDPMDWPLPCDVTVGHGTIGRGCALRTLVGRMSVLYDMAVERSGADVVGEALRLTGHVAMEREAARARDRMRSTETEGLGPEGERPGGDSHAPKEEQEPGRLAGAPKASS